MIFINVSGAKRFDIQFKNRAISSEDGIYRTEDREEIEYLRNRKDFVESEQQPGIKPKVIRGAKGTDGIDNPQEVFGEVIPEVKKPTKKEKG